MSDKMVLAIGRKLQFLSAKTSLQDCLGVHRASCLTSSKVSDPRDQGRTCNALCDLALRSCIIIPAVFHLLHRPTLVQCGRRHWRYYITK